MRLLALWANAVGWPLLSLTLVIWARERALRAARPTFAWFTYIRRARMIASACMTASLVASASVMIRTHDWSGMRPGSAAGSALLAWCWVFLPLVAIQVVVPPVSHDVARRLGTTELDWSDVRRQVMWSVATFVCTTLGIVQAMGAVWRVHWAAFGLWLIFAVVAGAWAGNRLRRAMGLTPHAVTHGDLRDHLFATAARARVRLTQLYVLPMKRMRLANAFAVQNGVVVVTDLLLDQLSREEVDSVMAHEIGHLRHRHPEKLRATRFAALVLPILALLLGGWTPAVVTLLLTTIGSAMLSRHFERVADREVLGLGASGEALIRGLVKLAAIGHVPVKWSRWTGWWLTHPSVEQRAWSMAHALDLPPERAAEWLSPLPASGEHYPIPVIRPEGKLFSTSFKHGVLLRNTAIVLLASALTPALIARLALPMAPADRGWAWLAALVITPLVCVAIGNFLLVAPLHALRRRMRDRLSATDADSPREASSPIGEDAVFAGLAPHRDVRVYEGVANWDLGFVWERDGLLHFRGEECSFALSPAQVDAIELVAGSPHWIATRSVRIGWRDAAGAERALRLTPLQSSRLTAIAPNARRLHARFERWRKAGTSVAAPPDLAPPSGEITSLSPRQLIRPASYLRFVPLALLASVAACGIAGAPIDPLRGMGFLEVLATCCLNQVLLTLPLARYREPAAPVGRAEAPERVAA